MVELTMHEYNAIISATNSACAIIQQLLVQHENMSEYQAAEETVKRVSEYSEKHYMEKRKCDAH